MVLLYIYIIIYLFVNQYGIVIPIYYIFPSPNNLHFRFTSMIPPFFSADLAASQSFSKPEPVNNL